MKIISRTAAASSGLKRYFTGTPCKGTNGHHIGQRYVSNGGCVECMHAMNRSREPEKKSMDDAKYYLAHREIIKAKAHQYYETNKSVVILKQLAYSRKNADSTNAHKRNNLAKRRGAPGKHGASDLRAIRKLQRNRCAYCRALLKNCKQEVDHIVPISRGGANDRRNIQILCHDCNQKKKARDPVDFAQSLGMLL